MNFKLGDLVRFVDEPIEGHITSFQGNNLIGVTDDTGFEIPVLASKLTLVHGNMKRDDDNFLEEEAPVVGPFIDRGIFLAVAGEQKDGLAKFYIINGTSYELLTSISELSGSKTTGLFANNIPKQDFAQVYTANFATVGKWPTMHIQIVRHSRSSQTQNQPLSIEFRVKPLDLIQSKEMNTILGEKVWLFELDKPQENIGLDKLKSHFISHRPSKK